MLKEGLAHPDNFIPRRSALRLPLDTSVVEKMSRMTSLNLGSVQSISDKLRDIIESLNYTKAAPDIEIVVKKDPIHFNFLLPIRRDIFGCRRGQNKTNIPARQLNLNDHLAAVHPLVSIYYLTRE
jgi:hypothetical protein